MHSLFRIAPMFSRIAILVMLVAPASAAEHSDYVALVKRVQGTVEVEREGTRQAVAPGFRLEVADTVHTGPAGAVGITFTDNSLIALGPDSTYSIAEYSFDSTTQDGSFRSRISRGTLSARSGRIAKRGEDRMLVETPATILGVRGTRFLIKVDD